MHTIITITKLILTSCFCFFVAQNQWIRENLLDGYGNYAFCQQCILAFLDVSKERLQRQREIKRRQNQQPIVTMTKKKVTEEKLESHVLHPLDIEMTPFTQWWKPLSDEAEVEVRYPHERHGLAGKQSNHAKPSVMKDFLEFIDNNSQPNGRAAGSHSAQFFLSPKFTRIDPPKANEKNSEQKSRSSLVAEFNRAQVELGRDTCGKTAGREWLKQHRPKHALHPSMTDYCDTCKIKKEELSRIQAVQNRLLQSGNASEGEIKNLEKQKENCEEEMKEHREHAQKSREYYQKTTKACNTEWEKISSFFRNPHLTEDQKSELKILQHCFTLVISADYQQAKLIPFWGESEQPGSTYYLHKVSIEVFGISDHRNNTGHIDLFEEQLTPKNTDHTLSFLTNYWENIIEVYPWMRRLHIFLDNATSTNKNRYLFSWAVEMVKSGKVDMIHISFLIAGHTKFAPDRLFANVANAYKNADVFTIEELEKICLQFATTTVENGTHILTWRESLGQKYTELPGVRSLHDFLFFKSADSVVTKVRELCYSGAWKQSPLHPKDPSLPGIPTENYKDNQFKTLKKEKMEHMISMYNKFIAPNRRPSYLPSLPQSIVPSLSLPLTQPPPMQHTRRKSKCSTPGCDGTGHRNKSRWQEGHTTRAGCPRVH